MKTTMQNIYECHIAKAFALQMLCTSRPIYIWQITQGITPTIPKEMIKHTCNIVAKDFYSTLEYVYGENPINEFIAMTTFVLSQLTPDIADYFFKKDIENNKDFESQIYKMFMYIITGHITNDDRDK